jgi:dTMP kinase
MSAPSGLFLTLEGGEGAGKSTLLAGLASGFAALGRETVCTREPGGTEGADAIRALLVTGAEDRWDAMTEALLIAAARRDHVRRVIAPALERGAVVLCDRYLDSTRAYQSGAGGLPEETVEELARLIAAPRPHLTLLLDLPFAEGLARARGRTGKEDRFERLGEAFHGRVRAHFLMLAQSEPDRIVVLDATLGPDQVLAAARAAIAARLGVTV